METPAPVTPLSPLFKDRRTGLILFGILEIILGGFCGLMLPLMIVGQVMTAKKDGHELDSTTLVPVLVTFTVLATGLIWLGIGSISARRWARALLLCFSWMALCAGLISLAAVVPTLSSMDEIMRQQGQQLPPGATTAVKFVTVAAILVMYIIIPGVLVLFYRSSHVKLTCEHRDPVVRWTDRCPLPVLAVTILQVFGAVYVVSMPRLGGTMPLFGFLVTGWTARLLWFGFAVLSIYAAWGFYRLSLRVWWIYLGSFLVFGLSSIVTFSRIELLDYYRAAGMPEWQIKQMAVSPLVHGHSIVWISTLSLTLFAAYLVYVRRFFRPAPDQAPSAGQLFAP